MFVTKYIGIGDVLEIKDIILDRLLIGHVQFRTCDHVRTQFTVQSMFSFDVAP